MKAEDYFDNSWCTSADLIEREDGKVGLNRKALFEIMEEYAEHSLPTEDEIVIWLKQSYSYQLVHENSIFLADMILTAMKELTKTK